ncbi:MAG: type II secretion system protein [Planctomycetota bacterium]
MRINKLLVSQTDTCAHHSSLITRPAASRSGFTLIELLVVTSISLLLMTVLTFIYANVLKVYRESQGLQEMYETARIFNRDLRDILGHVVPVRSAWIAPVCSKFPGVTDAVVPTGATGVTPNTIDSYYLDSVYALISENTTTKKGAMCRELSYYCDSLFSMPQFPVSRESQGVQGYIRGNVTIRDDNTEWYDMANDYPGVKGWWLPAFYGIRDRTVKPQWNRSYTVLEFANNIAGAWGWPRPDYRLDADADNLQAHGTIACWFYTENPKFHSACTLALDNANIVLTSLKFSQRTRRLQDGNNSFVDIPEETQLSVLRHQIVGFDTARKSAVREDFSLGNMLRSIKITPYYLQGGVLTEMSPVLQTGAGNQEVPRCFDVVYTLRNRVNLQSYTFALRVYCQVNQQ